MLVQPAEAHLRQGLSAGRGRLSVLLIVCSLLSPYFRPLRAFGGSLFMGWYHKSYVGYVHAVAHSLGGQYNVPHGLANAILLPLVLREYGSCIDKKLHRLAIAAGLADKNTPDHEATELFIRAIEEMKERFGIVNIVKEIQETDIPKLAHYADKEANPLYPVPKLMDASELEKFYYMLMSLTSKENTSEAEK